MPDLITISALKSWLATPTLPMQAISDALLQTVVDATSADFLRAINRTDFLAGNYTEWREGDGGCRITLRHWPIAAVETVSVAGTIVAEQGEPGGSGWYIDADLDPELCSNLYLAGSTFTDTAAVIITYTGGYATVPDDVVQAVIEWCAARYKGRAGVGLTSQREAGGEHVTFDRESPMPANTARVVEKYTREWPSLNKYKDDREYRITRITRNNRVSETIKETGQ